VTAQQGPEMQPDGIPADTRLLTVQQVGQMLQVHPRTCWRMAAAGDIPKPITIAKKVVRWRLSDLQRFLGAKG
jgi:predicted DNA-binding transcriptional regulator AlpA